MAKLWPLYLSEWWMDTLCCNFWSMNTLCCKQFSHSQNTTLPLVTIQRGLWYSFCGNRIFSTPRIPHCLSLQKPLCCKGVTIATQLSTPKHRSYTATHLITLQHICSHRNTLAHTATLLITLQHRNYTLPLMTLNLGQRLQGQDHSTLLATHCNTLQHSATHCTTLQHTFQHCSTMQHTAWHCNTLHHTASHCITLQHTATHSITHHFFLQHRVCRQVILVRTTLYLIWGGYDH